MERPRDKLTPQITVDAPIMIPEDYVPDLAVRMALYRRLNQAEGQNEIESLAAEMIDRFGDLPQPTKNLIRLIEIKHQAIAANIAKIDVGARGTLVGFHQGRFPRSGSASSPMSRASTKAARTPPSCAPT